MPDAFEYVQQGDELCQQKRLGEAERAFQRALRAYEKEKDASGMAYALGRMGNCYEHSGEATKAIDAYHRAIDLETDIPAVYYGLIPLLVEQNQLDEAVRIADRWQIYGTRHISGPAHQIFVRIGSQLTREKRYEQAVAVLSRAVEVLDVTRFPDEHWAARGKLGRTHEKAGEIDTAMGVFASAINDSSNDRQTYTRYIMYLERTKEYKQALRVTKQGLKVQRDASWEVDLRKRQQRIEKKAGLVPRDAEPQVIPVFSVRRGQKTISLAHQLKFSPQLTHLALAQGVAYTTSGGKSPQLSAWFIGNDVVLAWQVGLPEAADGLVATVSSIVTYAQQGRVGDGSTMLRFFDLSGNEMAAQCLPDAVSEVVVGGDQVFAGCRDGHVYAFSVQGASLWSYRVPGSEKAQESPYMRPCPYYLSAVPNVVAFTSYSSVFALNGRGKLLWQWSVPEKQSTSRSGGITVTISTGPASVRGLAVLSDCSRTIATADDLIYELVNGKVHHQIRRKGKMLGKVFVDSTGATWAIDAGERVLLIRDHKSAGSFAAPWNTKVDVDPGADRAVAWSGKSLLVTSLSGRVTAEVEFAKTISHAQSMDEGRIIVGAGDLVILDAASRQPSSVGEKAVKRESSLRAARAETLPVERPTHEQGIPIRWIRGQRLGTDHGKAQYVDPDGQSLTIEQFALEHYGQLGYNGSWSENEFWWAIMALLFWDVIFVRLPGVFTPELGDFPSRLQDMPRDFFSSDFYPRREKLIDRRMTDLIQSKFFGLRKPNIGAELKSAFHQHRGKPCRPIDWMRFTKVDSLLLAAQALTGEQLMRIMRRLLANFSNNRSGLPDLFMVCDEAALFAEIKSEKERVASRQFDWMLYLKNEVGVAVEICRVVEEN